MSNDLRQELLEIFREEFEKECRPLVPELLRQGHTKYRSNTGQAYRDARAIEAGIDRIIPILQPNPPKDREDRVKRVAEVIWLRSVLTKEASRRLAELLFVDFEPRNEHLQSRIEERDSVIAKRNETIIGLKAEVDRLKAGAEGPDRLDRICKWIRGIPSISYMRICGDESGSFRAIGDCWLRGFDSDEDPEQVLTEYIAEHCLSDLQREVELMKATATASTEFPAMLKLAEKELKGKP